MRELREQAPSSSGVSSHGGGAPGKVSRSNGGGGGESDHDCPTGFLAGDMGAPPPSSSGGGGGGGGEDPFSMHLLMQSDGPPTAAMPEGPRPSDQQVAQSGFRGGVGQLPDLDTVNRTLGGDFSRVPVHTGPEANAACRELGAAGYTHGGSVAFKSASPSVETQLHEATHLAQLGHVDVSTPITGGGSVGALEHEADRVASHGAAAPDRGEHAATAAHSAAATDEVLKQNDSGVESGTGVDAGIAAGTMVADAINGQKITVDVPGDYKVEFTFTKAYKGTYPYRAANRDVKGVYVRIDVKYTDYKMCGRCGTLEVIQVLRNTTVGADGSISTADPNDQTRRDRSGWGDAAAPSRGWRVDSATSSTAPMYSSSWVGQAGTEETPATIWDTPGDWSTTVNSGKDFYTSAVCTDASGRKTVRAGVHWGYVIDGSGTVKFSPATPVGVRGEATESADATRRWDGMAGNQQTGITH